MVEKGAHRNGWLISSFVLFSVLCDELEQAGKEIRSSTARKRFDAIFHCRESRGLLLIGVWPGWTYSIIIVVNLSNLKEMTPNFDDSNSESFCSPSLIIFGQVSFLYLATAVRMFFSSALCKFSFL